LVLVGLVAVLAFILFRIGGIEHVGESSQIGVPHRGVILMELAALSLLSVAVWRNSSSSRE